VLDELRSGAIQLSALVMLAPHLNETNAEALLTEARGKKKRQLERLIARWNPRPDVPSACSCSGQPNRPARRHRQLAPGDRLSCAAEARTAIARALSGPVHGERRRELVSRVSAAR
jgi:hypothetical protein